ncbi:hypothetical protein LSAT2_014151 [Lamellibrachia satsuma]|nr:hypothetical protein LSAT2_014151 [Lamellibrachia satsuma]
MVPTALIAARRDAATLLRRRRHTRYVLINRPGAGTALSAGEQVPLAARLRNHHLLPLAARTGSSGHLNSHDKRHDTGPSYHHLHRFTSLSAQLSTCQTAASINRRFPTELQENQADMTRQKARKLRSVRQNSPRWSLTYLNTPRSRCQAGGRELAE